MWVFCFVCWFVGFVLFVVVVSVQLWVVVVMKLQLHSFLSRRCTHGFAVRSHFLDISRLAHERKYDPPNLNLPYVHVEYIPMYLSRYVHK